MKQRLLGIDLIKGIAAFAVILVHSGDASWGIPVEPSAAEFRSYFYFAVPYFLATSFFLIVHKTQLKISQKFWISRIERILIPYIIWTIIYILLKIVIFTLTNQTEQINSVLQDLVAVTFLGGASYHLYFLPLLFTGSFLLFLTKYFNKNQIESTRLILLFILSLVLYQTLIWTGNSFMLGVNIAFPELLNLFPEDSIIYAVVRLILVGFAWLIRCLPYLLASIIFVKLSSTAQIKFNRQTAIFLWLGVFVALSILGKTIIPGALWEIMISFALLNLAISISSYVKTNRLIINLGQCSFGIYLLHPLIKSGVEVMLNKIFPAINQTVSINSIAIYSGLTFIISWYVVFVATKNKLIARYMFGA